MGVFGNGRPPKILSEAQVRWAMKCTESNAEACRFMNVSYNTYKKYAQMYFDEPSGKTLFELHKRHHGKGIPKKSRWVQRWSKYDQTNLEEILRGEHPEYDLKKLRKRLFKTRIIPLVCSSCGFTDKRIGDNKMPLLIDFIDGDQTNMRLDNLRLLCFNCFFLEVGSLRKSRQGMEY